MKTLQKIFKGIVILCLTVIYCNSCSTVVEGDIQTVCPHCNNVVNEVFCSHCKGHLSYQLGHITPEDEVIMQKNKQIKSLKDRLDVWQRKYDSLESKYRSVIFDPTVSTDEARKIYDELNSWVNTNLQNLFEDHNELNIEPVKDIPTMKRLLGTIYDKILGYNVLLDGMNRVNEERQNGIRDTIRFINIIGHGMMSIQEVNVFIQKIETEDKRKGGVISRLQTENDNLRNENEQLQNDKKILQNEKADLQQTNADLETENKKLEEQNNVYKNLLKNYKAPSISNVRLSTSDKDKKLKKDAEKLVITFHIDWREFNENTIELYFKIYPPTKNGKTSSKCITCIKGLRDRNNTEQDYSCSAIITRHNSPKNDQDDSYTVIWNRCEGCTTPLYPGKYDLTIFYLGEPIGYQNGIQLNKKN